MSGREPDSGRSQHWRVVVFYSTWILYAAYYFCRKDVSKLPEFAGFHGEEVSQVANLLFVFGLAYSGAQVLSGWLADRYGGTVITLSGALISGFATLAQSFYPPLALMLPLELINGLGQGFGWSGSLKMIGTTFGSQERSRVLAWWSASYILGGYLATFLATWFSISPNTGVTLRIRYGLLIPAVLLLLCSAAFVLTLRGKRINAWAKLKPAHEEQQDPTTWKTLFENDEIRTISLMYFFLKMMRYALLFWLPVYFTSRLGYSVRSAENIASLFTLFGFAGSLITVWISDRLMGRRRFLASAVFLFVLAFVCVLDPILCDSGWAGAVFSVSLMGMIIHGTDLLMSGIQTLDAVPPSLHGRAVGLVNASGSLGQMISALVVICVSRWWGWDSLFNLFVVCAIVSALFCSVRGNRIARTKLPESDRSQQIPVVREARHH